MRHKIKEKKLGRPSDQRISLLKNLSKSLIKSEKIKTTLLRAKQLRPYIEKLITLGKKGGLSNKKLAYSILQDKESVNKLFDNFSKRYENRNGGYSRIIKYGYRLGDNSQVAIIELINE